MFGLLGEIWLKAHVASIVAPHAVLAALAISGVVGVGLEAVEGCPLPQGAWEQFPFQNDPDGVIVF